MVHAALLLLMLRPYKDLVQPISLKRSTLNLLISTSSSADYPISGAHRASTVNSSSSASMPGKQRSPNTWQSVGGLHPRAGGRSCAVTLTASRRWTCSWFRPSPFDCSMDCSYCNTVGAESYGWESPRTQRLNGSPASSPRPTAGRQHRDTSSVTATPSTATFSFAAFRQWAFVTGRLRRDHHGKTDMRNG
jgi:hypothetical protein